MLIERAEAAEPITEIGCERERGAVAVNAEVATLANVFTLEKYGILPITAAVLVESPPNPTVAPESVTGHVTEIADCLLLKVLQSAEVR